MDNVLPVKLAREGLLGYSQAFVPIMSKIMGASDISHSFFNDKPVFLPDKAGRIYMIIKELDAE